MVTFPPQCAFRGLLDVEGFMLLSSAVGNVKCNMGYNHNGQKEGIFFDTSVGEVQCVRLGGFGSSVNS